MVLKYVQVQSGSRKEVFIPSATAFQNGGRRLNSSPSSGLESPPGQSPSSSKEDSDSDCTCDNDTSSNLEDSGLFSCEGEVDSIIAPPSPFVTRSYRKDLQQSLLGTTLPKDQRSFSPLSTSTPSRSPQDPVAFSKPLSLNSKALLQIKACSNSLLEKANAASKENCRNIEPKPIHSTTIYVNGETHSEISNDSLNVNKEIKQVDSKERTDAYLPRGKRYQSNELLDQNSIETNDEQPSLSYASVPPPICYHCARKDLHYFVHNCSSCWSLLHRDDATPSHVFAVLRLWLPPIQKCITRLVQRAIDLGCGVRDRDAVTDMTLLHYAVKSGSVGIGDPEDAEQVVEDLLEMGADLRQRCKWTSMTALHYAAYFDVPNVLDNILQRSDRVFIDDPCIEYNNGSPLHIAAANLSEGTVRVLLGHGASKTVTDNQGRVPLECIPSYEQYGLVPDLQELLGRLNDLLQIDSLMDNCTASPPEGSFKGIWGKAILKAIGLSIGDRVLISGVKTGLLRYAGPTEFSTGLWAGVELETPQGRHNGIVKGVVYFRCSKNYGLFVPLNRLTKIPNVGNPSEHLGRERKRTRQSKDTTRRDASQGRRSLSLPPGRVNHGRVDVSKIESRVAQDIKNSERKLEPDDRVTVDMGLDCIGPQFAQGVVRFTGPVHFACGYWIGIELDEAHGSHDGSVCGTQYFSCARQRGIFAAPSRVTKITEEDKSNHALLKNRLKKSSSNSLKMTPSLTDSFSSVSSSGSLPVGAEGFVPLALPGSSMLKTSFYPTHTSMNNLNKCFSARYIRSRQRQIEVEREKEEKRKEPQWEEPPHLYDPVAERKPKKEDPHWLQVGHTVFYRNNVGTVKFIGQVSFAEGIWLGVDLREKKGKHNGQVNGERYFQCRYGHGIIVRPSKVTVHGINGSLLVKQEDYINNDPYDNLDIL